MAYLKIFLALLLCAACYGSEKDDLIQLSNNFSINLFKNVAIKEKNSNLLLSPINIYVILAMASYGSTYKSPTNTQMLEVLNLPDKHVAYEAFPKFIENYLKVYEDEKLSFANKMFLADDFTAGDYNLVVNHMFMSDISELNTSNSIQTVENINEWARNSTNGRIKDFVNEDIIKNARMLILSAINFEAEWKEEFEESKTSLDTFYTGNSEKKVTTMRKKEPIPRFYLKNLKATFIKIPYKNDDLSMTVIVPNENNTVDEIIQNLNLTNFDEMINMKPLDIVKLHMPKFKVEDSNSLRVPLTQLGMVDVFDIQSANFSKRFFKEKDPQDDSLLSEWIDDSFVQICKILGRTICQYLNVYFKDNLYIKDINQKIYIEVNEKGSQVCMTESRVERDLPDDFKVDRPSLMIITKGKTIIFMLRLYDPEY